MSIIRLLRTGLTARYHTEPAITPQNVAAHTWGVVVLLLRTHPNPSRELLLAAALHDCGEAFTGDAPYPAKNAAPELRALLHRLEAMYVEALWGETVILSDEEKRWLKWADMTECAIHCVIQLDDHGTPAAKKVLRNAVEYLIREHSGLSEATDAINNELLGAL